MSTKNQDTKRPNNARGGKGGGKRNKQHGGSKQSRSLTWLLRHNAPALNIEMSEDGFVRVEDILNHSHPKLSGFTEEKIRTIVAEDEKQRFTLKEEEDGADDQPPTLYIRANQGHSIEGILDPESLLTRIEPEELAAMEVIVHGTYLDPWRAIRSSGLSKMRRTHIHFASGLPKENGVISGMRTSCQVYIYVDGKKCAEDGVVFYKSDNGVILTEGKEKGMLPTMYFSHVITKDGKVLLDNR